jgi:hypothetical protein
VGWLRQPAEDQKETEQYAEKGETSSAIIPTIHRTYFFAFINTRIPTHIIDIHFII